MSLALAGRFFTAEPPGKPSRKQEGSPKPRYQNLHFPDLASFSLLSWSNTLDSACHWREQKAGVSGSGVHARAQVGPTWRSQQADTFAPPQPPPRRWFKGSSPAPARPPSPL